MRISPIILFSVDFIIYAIFDEDLSQDLSARGIRLVDVIIKIQKEINIEKIKIANLKKTPKMARLDLAVVLCLRLTH